MTATTQTRLSKLQSFLQSDPENLPLLLDAADAALDAQDPGTALELAERYEALAAPPPTLLNIIGLAHLKTGEVAKAAAIFETLVAATPDAPSLRFNLGWCRLILGDYAGARDILDSATTAASAAAAAARIQALHHLGLLDEALAEGAALVEIHPSAPALMSALAVVALDNEDTDLARLYAAQAGGSHEGLSTLGMLVLNESQPGEALTYFDKALSANPESARGLLGKGLALMNTGEIALAPRYLDQGAAMFGDHAGSWIASGWAYYVNGDRATSRKRFEKALALDDAFAESHGALAVLDIDDGLLDSARRRAEVALRLDRACFSGALAMSMLATADGDAVKAERIRNLALNAPIGPDKKTIAQALVRMGHVTKRGNKRS